MKILIKNGCVIDPANKREEVLAILISGTKISRISKDIKADAERVIDARDKIVMPGIVDMHVHLREPGREDKETVSSGTMAAGKGGVTTLLAMPNTLPPIDGVRNAKILANIIKKSAHVNVLMTGAITVGRLGKKLCDIGALKKQGTLAITDDGNSVDNNELMLKAFMTAKKVGILVICHSEDRSLSGKGVVNLGFTSTRLGLRGISKESEYKRIQRDVKLAEKVGAPIHVTHISCRESVEIIAKAKKRGVRISADTAPHYFSLTEEDVVDYNTNLKVNPPLRSKDDREAIKQGLREGIIDAIASDHAPHTENEKDIEFEYAASGTIGLETELAVSVTALIQTGVLDWAGLVEKMCSNPARILHIDKGSLDVGKDADLIIVSPEEEWVVRKEDFLSKSKNSAFLGRRLKGVVEYTICRGKVIYQKDAVTKFRDSRNYKVH